jgi:hypothetical protein
MNEQLNQPAFPPMVAQDSLGRVIIMAPGMSKLEWYSLFLLPNVISNSKNTPCMINGNPVTYYEAALYMANELINAQTKFIKNVEQTKSIIK